MEIYGCMDPNAPQYNPDADTDDGTCLYPGMDCCYFGYCEDAGYYNYTVDCSGQYCYDWSVYDGDGTVSGLLLSATRVGAAGGALLTQGGSDISASAIELNYLDGSIPGTAVASKAVVLDSNKALDEIGLGTIQWSSTSPGSATAGVLRYDGTDLFLGYTS